MYTSSCRTGTLSTSTNHYIVRLGSANVTGEAHHSVITLRNTDLTIVPRNHRHCNKDRCRVCNYQRTEMLQYIPSSSMILMQVSAFGPILILGSEVRVMRTENCSVPSLASSSSMIGALPQTVRLPEDGSNTSISVVAV